MLAEALRDEGGGSFAGAMAPGWSVPVMKERERERERERGEDSKDGRGGGGGEKRDDVDEKRGDVPPPPPSEEMEEDACVQGGEKAP